MGWLEVLAMLKRLMPLLTRVAPMLETFIASRGAASAGVDAAMERVQEQLRLHRAAGSDHEQGVREALDTQAEALVALMREVEAVRQTVASQTGRLAALEQQAREGLRFQRAAAVVLGLLLIVAVVLLGILVAHHR